MKTSKLSPAQTRTLAKLRFTRVEVSTEESEAAKARGETLHFTTWHEWSYDPADNTIRLDKTWSGNGIQATIRCLAAKGHLDIVSDKRSSFVVRLIDGPTSTFKLRVRRGEAVHVYEYLAESEAELRDWIAEHYGNLPFEILDDAPAEEPVTVREAGTAKGFAIPAAPVSMVGRDYNLVKHVLEGSAPWAIAFLHNRDLWAVRQELPEAVLAHRSSVYYERLTRIAEERREAQEAATA